MWRIVGLGIVVMGVGCAKRAPVSHPPDPGLDAEIVAPPASPPKLLSPSEALSEVHGTTVDITDSISFPDGFVVGYDFDRADAEIGEMLAKGIDVQAEIDEADAACEREREGASDDEMAEWIFDDRSCSELALGEVLGDEELSLGCIDAGLAYFDLQGRLLHHELLGGDCTDGIGGLELRQLVPEARPQLIFELTTHDDVGDFSRGGWGFRVDTKYLHVVDIQVDEDGVFISALELLLDRYREGGNCGGGTRGGLRVGDSGTIDHYTRDYNECDDEGCIMPDQIDDYRESMEFEDDEELDIELCSVREVTVERYTWRAGIQEWDGPGDVEEEVEEIPDDLDY